MKIAYLSTFYPFRGGIAQFNASLYRQLEKDHELRALTFTRQYPDMLFPGTTQYVTEGDHADQIPAEQILDSINPSSYFRTAAALRAFRPDLLLMKFWMPFFAPSLGFVAGKLKKRGTKVISILDNVIPHEPRLGDTQLIRYFLKRNNGFVAMSSTVAGDLQRLLPSAVYTLKPHPIYDHFGSGCARAVAREKLGLPAVKKILLFFGFIRDYKGLDDLILAMRHLSADYLLVIAGEVYGDFDKYDQLIQSTQTETKIARFVRYINDDEVPLFFSAADVCVLPYKSATQSGIVQIAFNFNLPVIVTAVGGLAEMVDDGKTGLVLAKKDDILLAKKIRSYFDGGWQAVFSRAIAESRSRLSWVGFAQAILQLYERLGLDRRPSSSR